MICLIFVDLLFLLEINNTLFFSFLIPPFYDEDQVFDIELSLFLPRPLMLYFNHRLLNHQKYLQAITEQKSYDRNRF